jgi:hypothetical protein
MVSTATSSSSRTVTTSDARTVLPDGEIMVMGADVHVGIPYAASGPGGPAILAVEALADSAL